MPAPEAVSPLLVHLLVLLLVVSALTLLVQVLQWLRIDRLSERVTRLEAQQKNCLSAVDVRNIWERLASIEAKTETSTRLMTSIQEHLLESDR